MRTFEVKRVLTKEEADTRVGLWSRKSRMPLFSRGGHLDRPGRGGAGPRLCPFPGRHWPVPGKRPRHPLVVDPSLRGRPAERVQGFRHGSRKAVLKRESCRPSALYYERPDIEAVLEDTALELSQWIETYLPDISEEDRKEVLPKVLPEWRLGEETIWTSGVINLTASCPTTGTAPTFTPGRRCPSSAGGAGRGAASPRVRREFRVPGRVVVYFPGWRIVHSVTPMRKVEEDGYRISVVYYSLKGMMDCHTWAMEQAGRGDADSTGGPDAARLPNGPVLGSSTTSRAAR